MEQLAMDVAGPYPITTLRAPAWMIAEQRGCVAVEEIGVRRFSEHFREREGTLPRGEFGRAKPNETSKTGTTQVVNVIRTLNTRWSH